MLDFVFRGLRPYVRAAAETAGKDLGDANTLRFLGKSEESWHAKQLQQGLGSLSEVAKAERAGLALSGSIDAAIANLAAIRDSLAILLNAADAAIAETTAALTPSPPPEPIADATPKADPPRLSDIRDSSPRITSSARE